MERRELTLFAVDVEDLGLDDLADAEDVGGVVEALFGGDLGDVDEAFDAFGDLDEGAELGDAGDGAFDDGAGVDGFDDLGPGVAEGLLEAEGRCALRSVSMARMTASTVVADA